jgi:hypothetical protein
LILLYAVLLYDEWGFNHFNAALQAYSELKNETFREYFFLKEAASKNFFDFQRLKGYRWIENLNFDLVSH